MKKSVTAPRRPGVRRAADPYAEDPLAGTETRKHEIVRAAPRKLRMVAL